MSVGKSVGFSQKSCKLLLFICTYTYARASQGVLVVKNHLPMQEKWIRSLSRRDRSYWRREWQTTPVFLLGDSHDRGSWWVTARGSQRDRSPGGGNGKQLQYSCLEIPMTKDPGGLQPGGHKEWDMTEAIEQYPFTHYHTNERIELLNCLIKAFSHPTFYN